MTPASTVLDGFLYASVAPISLLAGQVYVIGAEQTGGIDGYLSPVAGLVSFSVAPEITYGNGRIAPTGGFTRPNNLTGPGGRFGPNFPV